MAGAAACSSSDAVTLDKFPRKEVLVATALPGPTTADPPALRVWVRTASDDACPTLDDAVTATVNGEPLNRVAKGGPGGAGSSYNRYAGCGMAAFDLDGARAERLRAGGEPLRLELTQPGSRRVSAVYRAAAGAPAVVSACDGAERCCTADATGAPVTCIAPAGGDAGTP